MAVAVPTFEVDGSIEPQWIRDRLALDLYGVGSEVEISASKRQAFAHRHCCPHYHCRLHFCDE